MSHIKKFATGNGRAAKFDMMSAASERWPGFVPTTDDEADARWIAELTYEEVMRASSG